MSHFYADIQGSRGTATKGGTKKTGISGHIRGWEVGARVTIHHNEQQGLDEVTVYKTSGSQDTGHDVIICRFTKDGVDFSDNPDLKPLPIPSHADKIRAISQPGDQASMTKPQRLADFQPINGPPNYIDDDDIKGGK